MTTEGRWEHHAGRRKFKEARFIIAVDDKGKRTFICKVYGHEGQPVFENAELICNVVNEYRDLDKMI